MSPTASCSAPSRASLEELEDCGTRRSSRSRRVRTRTKASRRARQPLDDEKFALSDLLSERLLRNDGNRRECAKVLTPRLSPSFCPATSALGLKSQKVVRIGQVFVMTVVRLLAWATRCELRAGRTHPCQDNSPLSQRPVPFGRGAPFGGSPRTWATNTHRSVERSDTAELDGLEGQAVAIVRDAFRLFAPCCVLWSMGKDSTALLWLMRKAFLGAVPMPVVQLDTGMELPEVYEFRDRIAREWNLDLRVEQCPPEESCDPSLPPQSRAAARKTEGLRAMLAREGYRAVFVGIRRDEQATRAKERLVSPRALDGNWNVREQPPEFWGYTLSEIPHGGHVRVHPLLPWTELDVWRYHKREAIPIVPLYLAREGMRYRSLGEKNITVPIASNAATIDEIIEELATTREPERAGRTMDQESEASFERLRTGGYM